MLLIIQLDSTTIAFWFCVFALTFNYCKHMCVAGIQRLGFRNLHGSRLRGDKRCSKNIYLYIFSIYIYSINSDSGSVSYSVSSSHWSDTDFDFWKFLRFVNRPLAWDLGAGLSGWDRDRDRDRGYWDRIRARRKRIVGDR